MNNTTLDDIAAVIGFTATLRLAAWFADQRCVYIPKVVKPDQILVRLLGESRAKRLSENWPGKHVAVFPVKSYAKDRQKKIIHDLVKVKVGISKIALILDVSDHTVFNIIRELELAGLLEPIAPEAEQDAPAAKGGD